MIEIKYTHYIQDWLDSLTKEKLKSITKLIETLKILGLNIRLPYSKSLRKNLFELRDKKYGLRIYYTYQKNQIVILLNGGDKTSQTKDIIKARKIMKEVEDETSEF